MRYAVKLGNGQYLRRASNPTWCREGRRWLVDTLEEATIWHAAGHAKNAVLAAVARGHLKKSGDVYLVPVKLVEASAPSGPFRVKTEKYRTKLVEASNA